MVLDNDSYTEWCERCRALLEALRERVAVQEGPAERERTLEKLDHSLRVSPPSAQEGSGFNGEEWVEALREAIDLIPPDQAPSLREEAQIVVTEWERRFRAGPPDN